MAHCLRPPPPRDTAPCPPPPAESGEQPVIPRDRVLALLAACAELFEVFEEFRADLGWVAAFAVSAARMGLAAQLDPEAARAVGEVALLRADLGSALSSSRGRFATLKTLFDARGADLIETECDLDAANAEIKALRDDLEALRAAVRRHLAADTLAEAEPAWRALEHLIERDDARTLAHEAKLEFSAAREACEQLRGELADWRGIAASEQREAAEVRAQLEELRGLALNAIESRERLKVANGGGVATDSEAMVIRVDCQDAWAALVKAVTP